MLDQGMRIVWLSGLEPETEYICEIVTDGVIFHDQGGPFTFKTARIGIGMPYTVFGRLTDERGGPLHRTLVFLEAVSGEVISAPLAAVTDTNGFWSVNLGNLKTAVDGLVQEWHVGDELRLTFVYGDVVNGYLATVSGESPQSVLKALELPAGTTFENKGSQVSLPKAFALGQNYPNPLNPSTTISYSVPEGEGLVLVSLRIYNLRGQVVRVLVEDLREPGIYTVSWNGTWKNGRQVASGVYLYRMKAGSFMQTRKMVLLK
ncbi:T9SS type A sorting domain-containing protein [Gemmatimonadota bacterium]